MKRRSFNACVLALGLSCVSGQTAAHGPPPAILHVAAAEGTSPRVIGLTEGLAIRLADRWVFACPSLFGPSEIVPALSADGRLTWVAGVNETFSLDEFGHVRPVALPPGNDGPVVALTVASGSVFGLRFSPAGVDVVKLDPSASEVVFSDTRPWSVIGAKGDALLLARIEDGSLIVIEMSPAGSDTRTSTFTAGWQGALVNLGFSSGALHATVFDGRRYELFRVAEVIESLFLSDSPIFGPVTTQGGTVWFGTAGRLAQSGDGGVVLPPGRLLNCLENRGNGAFLCAQDRLHPLEDWGLGATLVGLDQLVPPAPGDGDLVGSEACWNDWIVFRNDLESIGIGGDREDPDGSADANSSDAALNDDRTASAAGCGCSTPASNTVESYLALVLVLGLVRHRKRVRTAW